MMTLLFRDCADAIHEIQGLLEVGEPEVAAETMLVADRPFRYLCEESSEFRSLEPGGVSATGNAGFAGEVGHGSVLDSMSLPHGWVWRRGLHPLLQTSTPLGLLHRSKWTATVSPYV
jgi:hypothetical protein